MGFAEEMEQHDEEFAAAAASAGMLPDGDYNGAVLTEMSLIQNEYGWSIATKWTVEGVGSIRRWYNLDTEERRGWAAQDLRKMGYEGKLSELDGPIQREEFVGLVGDIVVKTKEKDGRSYTNCYVNRINGRTDVLPSSPAPGSDDDIPF